MGTGNAATGAVDIGGTKIAVGVIDATGKVLARSETPTAARDGFEAALTRIVTLLAATRERAGVELCGIGIGCTGPVIPRTGEIGKADFLPGWEGCNLVARLAAQSGLRVALENDADAAALGELRWGAGRGLQSLICVTVGTGIGGGIIVNGALYRGVGGAHPEIGHHVIDDSGPLCYCGARGCWEALACGPAIAAHALREAPADYPHRAGLTTARLCDLARQGDAVASREIARAGRYLGIGIANLVTLYTPEAIVLSGGVMDSAELLMPAIREVVRNNCTQVPAADVALLPAALGSDAPLIGAGAAWWHRYEGGQRPC